MPGIRRGRKGGKGGKAVARATHARLGKYSKQFSITEANRLRKQANHKLRHPNDKEKPSG